MNHFIAALATRCGDASNTYGFDFCNAEDVRRETLLSFLLIEEGRALRLGNWGETMCAIFTSACVSLKKKNRNPASANSQPLIPYNLRPGPGVGVAHSISPRQEIPPLSFPGFDR